MPAGEEPRHIPAVQLTCRKAGGTNQVEFLKIKLSDCLVSSYSLGETPSDSGFSALGTNADLATDQMTLNFVKIDFLYTVARTGEQVETSFDAGGTSRDSSPRIPRRRTMVRRRGIRPQELAP